MFYIGGAPECTTDPDDCDTFGFKYVRSDAQGGDGEPCNTGTKVLCRSPTPENSLIDTPATALNVLSYNIFERNWFMSHDGQRERTCRVPATLRSMLPYVDAIGFQVE